MDQAETLRKIMQNGDFIEGEQSVRRSTTTSKGGKTRIIAIASGKGGVGKTNLATNMAIAYAGAGKRVVLMDADLGLANVNVVLGIIPKYNLYHMIRKHRTLEEILMDTDFGIQIVAGASGFAKIANLSEKERQSFVAGISSLSKADVIIVDTGAGVAPNVLSFIAAAHETIIVTTPEPTAITDAYGIIKVVATEIEDHGLGLKLIVNRVKSALEGTKVAKRVIDIAGQFLNIKIDYLGHIYEDEVVQRAVLKQKPFCVLEPKSKATQCIRHIVGRLEQIDIGKRGGLSRFVGRLFSGTSKSG